MEEPRDHGLDRLLDLHGQVVVLTEDGDYWVKFDVERVPATDLRPHGLKYSLTLHGPDNERLVGFDNAHPVPPATWTDPHDHRHFYKRRSTVRLHRFGRLAPGFLGRDRPGIERERYHTMSTLRIGIATYEEMKARTMAIARGEITPSPTDPKVWFPSMESVGKVLSSGNMMLLGVIASQRPQSLDELSQMTGRHKSNLSRTLHTMEKYGLVDLVHGERGRIVPNVLHEDVSIGFSINESSQTKV